MFGFFLKKPPMGRVYAGPEFYKKEEEQKDKEEGKETDNTGSCNNESDDKDTKNRHEDSYPDIHKAE